MKEPLKNYDRIHWQVKPKTGATKQLAENLANCNSGDIPAKIVAKTKLLLLDALGCMIAGAGDETCGKLMDFIKIQGGKKECTVALNGYRTNRYNASLLNGAYCQASGLDARNLETMRCAGVVVPSALAMAERLIREGNRLIAAIALGWEMMCRLNIAAVCVPTTRPLDPTSTFGPFGAAVAAAKLMDFSAFDMENAISLCPAQAAAPARAMHGYGEIGLLHGGFAASWGVRSACLAKEGLSGPRQILEGNMGFYKCISGFHDDDRTTRYDVDLVNENFGEKWLLEDVKFVEADGRHSFVDPSFSDIARKFSKLCDDSLLDSSKREIVIRMVWDLENVDDCAELVKQLCR